MIGAIVRNDVVCNLIVIDESNVDAMSDALNCEIVDARKYGLVAGDLRTEHGWTRNENGEQVILTPLEPDRQDGYDIVVKKLALLEASQPENTPSELDEILAILTGEVEE